MAAHVAPMHHWAAKRRRLFQSVFDTHNPLPPQSQESFSQASTDRGRDFGGHPVDPSDYTSTAAPSFLATPIGSQSLSGQNEGLNSSRAGDIQSHLARAWLTVKSKLQLVPAIPTAQDSGGLTRPDSSLQSPAETSEFNAALGFILQHHQANQQNAPSYDVLTWYKGQVRGHFIQQVLPQLAVSPRQAWLPDSGASKDSVESAAYEEHMTIVQSSVRILDGHLRQYISHLSLILRAIELYDNTPGLHDTSDVIIGRYTQDLHALIANSAGSIIPSLRVVLKALIERTLQISGTESRHCGREQPNPDAVEVEGIRERLLYLVENLNQVGLAGESFQILFAETMDQKLTEFIQRSYEGVWKTSGKSRGSQGLDKAAAKAIHLNQASWCILSLCDWIEKHFARLAVEVLSRVDKSGTKSNIVSLADVQQWKEIGIGRIAALRISELFDIVLQWPTSQGALDDLKASVTTPQRRWQLTNVFAAALQKRLLHPAQSTLDILRVYISMIRTFHALDHSKVLLGRVVPSLQLYLVQREDAVRMVVTGLLANPEEVEQAQKASSAMHMHEDGGETEKLVELAVLLNDPDQQRRMDVEEEDLDWDDMDWVPDPVDAGVNYKRPKSEDVIGTLITTLGSEDVFIKEFQNIIAENLLSRQTDFPQEQKVMDLLKKRFGEAALQNCEVMIKDVYDSRKVDTHIRRVELGQPPRPPRQFGTPSVPPAYMELGKQLDMDEEKQGQVPYHARILSRLYWPNIVQETFLLPQPVAQQQERYETGYERYKTARKLTWLHQLGQATVELELEDRSVNVECKTFEAAVIYAFQDDGGAENANSGPARRSVLELQEKLQMDDELVLQALDFWESQGVLARYSTNPDTYVVLEHKDAPPTRPELHPSASAPAALEGEHQLPGMPPKPAGIKRAGTTSAMDAKEGERRTTYWNFIVGMLTNTMPSMPLAQMAMMMRMLIPDGFPWSDQALQEFLTEKVELGELEIAAGKYKLVKK